MEKEGATAIYKKIVDYLNEKTGKHFKPESRSTRHFIAARLREGYSVDDFFTVIDNMTNQWSENPRMALYLRPSTLFGMKFESYINADCGAGSNYF